MNLPESSPKDWAGYEEDPEPDRVKLLLRVPVIARRTGRIEQKIPQRYLEILKDRRAPDAEEHVVPDQELVAMIP